MKLRSKKALGVFLSLAVTLCIVVPGTLAVETGTDISDNSISIGEGIEQKPENPATPTDASEAADEAAAPTDASDAADEAAAPTDAAAVPDETTVPTDGASGDPEAPSGEEAAVTGKTPDETAAPTESASSAPTGDQDAAVGETPDETVAPTAAEECTCGGEDGIHTAQCPLYEAPAEPDAPAHIAGCSDQCDGTDCECECHQRNLFERLMACENYEELWKILEAASEEALMALTEEQNAQIEEKMLALEPQPLPEVVIEKSKDEPVVSEIIYPTVNFTNVAPFGDPVVG